MTQVKNALDLERDHFEHDLMHDLKAAAIVLKRHGLAHEFYAERQKILDGVDLGAVSLPKADR
jgi:hypothetical protein